MIKNYSRKYFECALLQPYKNNYQHERIAIKLRGEREVSLENFGSERRTIFATNIWRRHFANSTDIMHFPQNCNMLRLNIYRAVFCDLTSIPSSYNSAETLEIFRLFYFSFFFSFIKIFLLRLKYVLREIIRDQNENASGGKFSRVPRQLFIRLVSFQFRYTRFHDLNARVFIFRFIDKR